MARQRQRRPRRSKGSIKQRPWQTLRNPYSPIEVLTREQVETIHDASLTLLETLGMEFLDADARQALAGAGASIDDDGLRVRFDRDMVLEYVAKAPSTFTLHARNPEHNLTFGENHINFTSVGSAPNVSDIDRGRRPGNFADYCDLLRLTQSLNAVHMVGGYPVEPIDLPPESRHLDAYLAAVTLTDKIWHPYSLGPVRARDGVDMLGIATGRSRDELKEKPGLFSVVNTNSPMRVDGPMLQGLKEMATAGQAIAVTPFTLSGAMSPVTLAGALTQQNAEALAVIAYLQLIAPGAPCFYGGFTSNVDMKSGAPAFGTPEYSRAALAGGQLARRYRIPYRSSNANAANVLDAQAAYESMMSLWGAVMGHANLIKHGAGWMEGGLTASFEKMILDADLLQMMAEFMIPIQVDESTIGLDAIAEAGPGGHFFGTAHTLERYETAFYEPILSDWSNFESWTEAGSATATERANRVWKQLLEEYEAPPIDAAIEDELKAFVEQRKGEIRKAA
jgi:trimethylamine---corrinoid protein Co-methyltransferase